MESRNVHTNLRQDQGPKLSVFYCTSSVPVRVQCEYTDSHGGELLLYVTEQTPSASKDLIKDNPSYHYATLALKQYIFIGGRIFCDTMCVV